MHGAESRIDKPYGKAIALNTANQVGATPWMDHTNWTIEYNIFDGLGILLIGLAEEYESGIVGQNCIIRHNLVRFCASGGDFVNIASGAGPVHTTISNNTVLGSYDPVASGEAHGGWIYVNSDGGQPGCVCTDNVGRFVTYGINGYTGWSAPVISGNYLINDLSSGQPYPSGVTLVANSAAMFFEDITAADAGGDYHGYRLTSSSPGWHATESLRKGVNFTDLDSHLANG